MLVDKCQNYLDGQYNPGLGVGEGFEHLMSSCFQLIMQCASMSLRRKIPLKSVGFIYSYTMLKILPGKNDGKDTATVFSGLSGEYLEGGAQSREEKTATASNTVALTCCFFLRSESTWSIQRRYTKKCHPHRGLCTYLVVFKTCCFHIPAWISIPASRMVLRFYSCIYSSAQNHPDCLNHSVNPPWQLTPVFSWTMGEARFIFVSYLETVCIIETVWLITLQVLVKIVSPAKTHVIMVHASFICKSDHNSLHMVLNLCFLEQTLPIFWRNMSEAENGWLLLEKTPPEKLLSVLLCLSWQAYFLGNMKPSLPYIHALTQCYVCFAYPRFWIPYPYQWIHDQFRVTVTNICTSPHHHTFLSTIRLHIPISWSACWVDFHQLSYLQSPSHYTGSSTHTYRWGSYSVNHRSEQNLLCNLMLRKIWEACAQKRDAGNTNCVATTKCETLYWTQE